MRHVTWNAGEFADEDDDDDDEDDEDDEDDDDDDPRFIHVDLMFFEEKPVWQQ